VRGKVGKVDQIGMTLTVDVKGKEETFKVTSKTRVFADSKPAIFADGKVGETVVVEFQNAKDKSREALAVRFGGPAPKAGAASTPVKPKAAAKKKKAATHKHEPTTGPAVSTPAPTTTVIPDAGSAPTTPAPTPAPGVAPQ
jgi:hypothetical protein